ncbi:MAG TPA: purine-nucleoside phosphorylase [Chiayiivirga sp.]|nr:purine-nucleoside phosphorylase [Chiayiivirga sp.]
MSTAHIGADAGAFADTVLLPGDPLRARHIATRFLEDAREITALRNMLGYSGHWRGRRLSVMGSGMGIPSCALYATELARHFGVRRILRIGTCGGVADDIALGDIVLAQGAATDSRFNRLHFGGDDFAACADFRLLRGAADAAARLGLRARVGTVFSTDVFYSPDPDLLQRLRRHRVLAVEMESAGLYGVTAREGVQALSLLMVSDCLGSGQSISAQARERGSDAVVELALATLATLDALDAAAPPL